MINYILMIAYFSFLQGINIQISQNTYDEVVELRKEIDQIKIILKTHKDFLEAIFMAMGDKESYNPEYRLD